MFDFMHLLKKMILLRGHLEVSGTLKKKIVTMREDVYQIIGLCLVQEIGTDQIMDTICRILKTDNTANWRM